MIFVVILIVGVIARAAPSNSPDLWPFDTGYYWPADETEPAAASAETTEQLMWQTLDTVQRTGFEFEGRITGRVVSQNEVVDEFTGSLQVSGDESDLVVGPDKPADDWMPAYTEVVAVGDRYYTKNRSSGSWMSRSRDALTGDSIRTIYGSLTQLADNGTRDVGGNLAHRFAATLQPAALNILGWDDGTTRVSAMFVEFWVLDSGELVGMELVVTYDRDNANGDWVQAAMTYDVAFDSLSRVSVNPPDQSVPDVSPVPSQSESVSPRPSASSTGKPVSVSAKTVLALLHGKDFQFQGSLSGLMVDQSFTGMIKMKGDDSDIVLGPGVLGPMMPDDSHIVRVGDNAYRQNRQSAEWTTLDRFYDGQDSLAKVFNAISKVADKGNDTFAGETVHHFAAITTPDVATIFGLPNFIDVWSDQPTLDLYFGADGRLVGMEFFVQWNPGEAGQGLTVTITVEKSTDVVIVPPGV